MDERDGPGVTGERWSWGDERAAAQMNELGRGSDRRAVELEERGDGGADERDEQGK